MSAIMSLQRGSIDRAAITLERAFSTDPLFTWIFPDPDTRSARLQRFIRVPLEYGVRYGRVTASHEAKAACVWLPPGAGMTMPRMIRSGMLGAPFRTGFGPFLKFMAANEIMDKIHKARAPEPHWYLVVVGVDPELQGQGVGSAIVRDGLAFADRESKPCYLDTSERRNLAFYERLGFVVLDEATLGKGGPKAWAMRREPRHATA
jgi:ribosomal protein S18 acetylase RimI-like enzyme